MRRTICITLNTAIDVIVEIRTLTGGTTTRALSTVHVPAGKAVNAAIGVAILGGRAIASGFVGTQSIDMFESLRSSGVEPTFVGVPGATRSNITLRESNGRETHIQTSGYSVSTEDVVKLTQHVHGLVGPGDAVVIGGSYPPGAPRGLARDLVSLCAAKGAYVILDASGEALRDGVEGGPSVMKPNMKELAELVGESCGESDDAIVAAARSCLSAHLVRVVVTRGRRGLLLVEKTCGMKATVDLEERFSDSAGVGCGDAVVAALAFSAANGSTPQETARLGAACGAANLLTRLPGRFSTARVEALLPRVRVEHLQLP